MDSLLAFKRWFLHVRWPVLSYLSFFYFLFVFFLFFFLDLVRPFLDLVRPHFLFFFSIFCIIINSTSKCFDVEFWLIFFPFPSNSSSPSLSIPPELWAVWIRLSLQNHPIKYKSKTSRSSCKRWSLTYHVGFTFSYKWTIGGRNQQVWAKCSLRR